MKWRAIILGVVILPVLLFVVGCGGKAELSRSKAEKLIQASTKFTPGEYPLVSPTVDAVRAGLQQGYWEKGPGGIQQLVLTQKGKAYFSTIRSWGPDQPQETEVAPKPTPRRVIEVTGIADGPGMLGPPGTVKDVQFTWKWDWDAVPQEAKPFLGTEPKPSKGEALLKLYDDGWRVEEIRLD